VSELPQVRLRPMTLDDADLLEAGHTPETDAFNWAGLRDPGWLRAAIAERRTITPTDGQLAVAGPGDVLLGDVGWRAVQTGATAASSCWSIGISLLPEHRGRGYGAAAQRELARYLFATTTQVRIEADTEVANLAEQRSLERAGFTREAVRRSSLWRDGAWRDTVGYAVLRGEL
jgi:RimJ/RimL family protein N-acetyltransferase